MSVKRGHVYILASQRNGTLYIGVTSHLVERICQHKEEAREGFTSKYGVHQLVYVETRDRILDAIRRVKQLKTWRRAWKLELIEDVNPEWDDLYDRFV
ncbi:MAG: GIY-YIG nuclease family protein [Rubricoccaceae bacterium]